MPVPLFDTKTPLAPLRGEIDAAMTRVVDSGAFILGPEVQAFEDEFAAYCGTAHAVGVAKVYGHFITVNYRESYDMPLCSGILFNHESPRRGLEFGTRKITWHAAAIKHGLRDKLSLGNLDARRDWGYAKDYVEAMWLMLQRDSPEDYVIATGQDHSVRDCVEIAFDEAGVSDWEQYVETDQALVRPAEVDHLIGDHSKAERELGWRPKTSFEELIRLMTRSDLELLER